MRTGLAYTSARILLLVISVVLLYLAGARGILLLALAFVISALASYVSYVLLSRQREVLAGALNRRLGRVTAKATEFRERLDEGTAAEDPEDTEGAAGEPAVAETSGEAVPRG